MYCGCKQLQSALESLDNEVKPLVAYFLHPLRLLSLQLSYLVPRRLFVQLVSQSGYSNHTRTCTRQLFSLLELRQGSVHDLSQATDYSELFPTQVRVIILNHALIRAIIRVTVTRNCLR